MSIDHLKPLPGPTKENAVLVAVDLPHFQFILALGHVHWLLVYRFVNGLCWFLGWLGGFLGWLGFGLRFTKLHQAHCQWQLFRNQWLDLLVDLGKFITQGVFLVVHYQRIAKALVNGRSLRPQVRYRNSQRLGCPLNPLSILLPLLALDPRHFELSFCLSLLA